MKKIGNLSAKMTLARGGKQMIAKSMANKGLAFIGAGLLLNQQKANKYVVLHLYGQGIECCLKGILLHKDYDKYSAKERKGKAYIQATIGHDIVLAFKEVCKVLKLNTIDQKRIDQLKAFGDFYKSHRLRYGNMFDILIDPASIAVGEVEKILQFLVRYCIRNGIK